MCGIVGYIGNQAATPLLLDGLRTLEYRGYDSAGVALLTHEDNTAATIETIKSAGRIGQLEQLLSDRSDDSEILGIGHTRWATHGSASTANSHPHSSSDGTISVVHNGIIENYQVIKSFLHKEGFEFVSETDTEVIPQLISYNFKKTNDIEQAFEDTLSQLEGAYAIAMISTHAPDTLFAAKLSSPLLIGLKEKELFLASDASALPQGFNKLIYLEDFEMAVIKDDEPHVKNFKEHVAVEKEPEDLSEFSLRASKGDFAHYMLKEIHDAPETIRGATAGRVRLGDKTVKLGGLDSVLNQLEHIDRIIIVACGTSYYAGMVGEYLIEEIAGIPVEVQLASEFKYRNEPLSRSTAVLAISQSGETADTIAALKKVEDYGILRLGIVNAPGSTIARMTDAGVYCHAGPEHSVASTKAFIAQVSILNLIALHLADSSTPLYMPLLEELSHLDEKAQTILDQAEAIQTIAKKYAGIRDILYIGRGYGYPSAVEGALKLKEVSYIHAEGYAAGEMKHGPLAMIDEYFPTFAITTDDGHLEKTISNIEEIHARKGPVIAITDSPNENLERLVQDIITVPKTLPQTQPILNAIALQLFAYYVALEKGFDIDQPRNLAKSVTVE